MMVDIHELKKELRQVGINFLTAGIVGVIINNFGGLAFKQRIIAATLLVLIGIVSIFSGLLKRVK
jgi:hypothetical protein